MIRKQLSESQVELLKPFNCMSEIAEKISGLSKEDYWFQIAIEVTVSSPTNSYAVLECHPRRG